MTQIFTTALGSNFTCAFSSKILVNNSNKSYAYSEWRICLNTSIINWHIPLWCISFRHLGWKYCITENLHRFMYQTVKTILLNIRERKWRETGVILVKGDVEKVISQIYCPTSSFFKLREKWFYIGYDVIERKYNLKDYHFSLKLQKTGQNVSQFYPWEESTYYRIII